mgnify:FL=1
MKQKVECERLYSHWRPDSAHVDYLHDYQHYYERGWPSDHVFLSVRCGYSEWHRYDASAGQSSEERRVYHLCRNSGYPVPAGRCFLVHSHRLGNWRCHLRFSDHGPK